MHMRAHVHVHLLTPFLPLPPPRLFAPLLLILLRASALAETADGLLHCMQAFACAGCTFRCGC